MFEGCYNMRGDNKIRDHFCLAILFVFAGSVDFSYAPLSFLFLLSPFPVFVSFLPSFFCFPIWPGTITLVSFTFSFLALLFSSAFSSSTYTKWPSMNSFSHRSTQYCFLPLLTTNKLSCTQGMPAVSSSGCAILTSMSLSPSSSSSSQLSSLTNPSGRCVTNRSITSLPSNCAPSVLMGSFSSRQSPCLKLYSQAEYSLNPGNSNTTVWSSSILCTLRQKNGPCRVFFLMSNWQLMSISWKYSQEQQWLGRGQGMVLSEAGRVGAQGAICFSCLWEPRPRMLNQPVIALRPSVCVQSTSWQEMLETSKMTRVFFFTLILLASLSAVLLYRTKSPEGWSSRQYEKAYLRSSTMSSWQSRQLPAKQQEANTLQKVSYFLMPPSFMGASDQNYLSSSCRKNYSLLYWFSQSVWKNLNKSDFFYLNCSLLQIQKVLAQSAGLRKSLTWQ